jgi:hypothetical protein
MSISDIACRACAEVIVRRFDTAITCFAACTTLAHASRAMLATTSRLSASAVGAPAVNKKRSAAAFRGVFISARRRAARAASSVALGFARTGLLFSRAM